MNTSFLQLTGGDYECKLALHARQFHQACGGDGPGWASQHHVCLLMTHHPPTWLHSQEHFNGHIVDHGRFAAHLCGHLHESAYRCTSEGGSETKCIWQSCSLFSTESLEKGGKNIQRLHGYTVGQIELDENKGSLMFWPRVENRLQGGERNIIPDYLSIRLTDEQTIPRNFDLLKPFIRLPKRSIPVDGAYSSLPHISSHWQNIEEPDMVNMFTKAVYAQFIYVVGYANELKTVGKENVDAYDNDGRERWKAYFPPVEKEIGIIIQEITAQKNIFYKVLLAEANLISRIKEAKNFNQIVIIIVDPWILMFSKYSELMVKYEQFYFFNCETLFVLNSEDIETQAKLFELRTEIKQTFFTKIRNSSDFLQKREALSEKPFRKKLISALKRTRENIIMYGQIRKIKGRKMTIPTINNT